MSQTQYGRCIVHGATIRGVTAVPVDVEVSVSTGMPSFRIVGMPDAAIQEARERIMAACRACDYSLPVAKIVVNLAPGSIRKTGTGFDLPIALGILAATGQIPSDFVSRQVAVGELSLDGQLRSVPGMLAYAICAHEQGRGLLSAPLDQPLPRIEGLAHHQVPMLSAMREEGWSCAPAFYPDGFCNRLDFKDVAGHDVAKRVLQIAAAGGHGVLMMGPPGSGKTMLASRVPSILPPLTQDQILETAVIHSVAGEPLSEILSGVRPFRAPHHSATLAGLIGGGSPVRPGEVTLAHNGVLFLDELAEFKPSALQGMRQPMESGRVVITRADGNISFPSCFALVAASNPCPCGFYGDSDHMCRCTENQVRAYQNRIGGPILDRIDMHLDVRRLPSSSVLRTGEGTSSDTLLQGVLAAREYASWRKASHPVEGSLQGTEALIAECRMDDGTQDFLERMSTAKCMSGRGIMRTLSVARTIADMEQNLCVGVSHLSEALGYRLREGGM